MVPNALTRLQIDTQTAALSAVSSELSADDCETIARVSKALAEGRGLPEADIIALAAIAKGVLERRLRSQVAELLLVSASLSADDTHLVQRVSDALAARAEVDVADQAALAILAHTVKQRSKPMSAIKRRQSDNLEGIFFQIYLSRIDPNNDLPKAEIGRRHATIERVDLRTKQTIAKIRRRVRALRARRLADYRYSQFSESKASAKTSKKRGRPRGATAKPLDKTQLWSVPLSIKDVVAIVADVMREDGLLDLTPAITERRSIKRLPYRAWKAAILSILPASETDSIEREMREYKKLHQSDKASSIPN